MSPARELPPALAAALQLAAESAQTALAVGQELWRQMDAGDVRAAGGELWQRGNWTLAAGLARRYAPLGALACLALAVMLTLVFDILEPLLKLAAGLAVIVFELGALLAVEGRALLKAVATSPVLVSLTLLGLWSWLK